MDAVAARKPLTEVMRHHLFGTVSRDLRIVVSANIRYRVFAHVDRRVSTTVDELWVALMDLTEESR